LLVLAVSGVLGTAAGATANPAAPAAPRCEHAFVPAYFWSGSNWMRAIDSKPAPGAMLLNVDSGPGTSPLQHFRTLVRRAHAAGITVLGYSSTVYGQRSRAAVEAEVRHYKAWYRVNGMFLDLAAATARELPYYRKLARYIRGVEPGSVIWLNPGAYPDRRYMSVGDVVLVFEGSYATYRHLQVPSWTDRYRRARFAQVIYATPASKLARAVRLSRLRRAGYVYVTNLQGSPNPYAALPSYWKREAAAIPVGCSSASPAAVASKPRSRTQPPIWAGGQGTVGRFNSPLGSRTGL
jgi:hypothetical protein